MAHPLPGFLQIQCEDRDANHGRKPPSFTQAVILRRIMDGDKLIVGTTGPVVYAKGGRCLWVSVSALLGNGYLTSCGDIAGALKAVSVYRSIEFPAIPRGEDPSSRYTHVPHGRMILPGAIEWNPATTQWERVATALIWTRQKVRWVRDHSIYYNPNPKYCTLADRYPKNMKSGK